MIKTANVKSYIKHYCGKVISRIHVRKWEDAVKQAEVISFDLFDTLVKRNVVKPEDIHKLVQREFFRQTGIELENYAERRVAAEKSARKNSRKEEICLNDIYDALCGVSDEWKNKLKEIEKQVEIEICTPNLPMQDVYKKALNAGKHIIFTSDMYLDEVTIRQILCKCGYERYEKLYLSSSFGLCKSRGSIYKIIKRDCGLYKQNILHIGDNVKADYVIPKKNGINALMVDGQPELLRYWKKSDRKRVEDQFLYQRLYCFLNNQVGNDYNDAEAIGYEILGPILLGYCKWLNQKIKADNIEKIFFLSREGKIFQDAFRILYPECEIEQSYLHVSRQALTVPLLADAVDFDEMAEIIKHLVHVPTISIIPAICMLNQKIFLERIHQENLKATTRIDEILDEKKIKLYSIIQDLGKNEFNHQKECIIKYLKENRFTGNIAVADIGWSGTMQKAMQIYTGDCNTRLQGYYLGVRNIGSNKQYAGLLRHGYLFSRKRNEKYNLMMRFTTEIIELLFLNTTGSVLRYGVENEHIIPILDNPEYEGKEGLFIKSVQRAAFDFLKGVKKDTLLMRETKVPEDIIMSAYWRFAIQPDMSVLKIFNDFQVLNGKVRTILPEHGILYYLVHISELKKDFEESSCKLFFLKKIFKVNLPYFMFLKMLLMINRWN